ncbi:hypothetical protein CEXT_96231 [Caerostris extrusa]|uniref:Uncharacterized protein n=1 Tax=Caerostris extrusa TaxID=172846 RepID=A0AAV4TZM6_CAEEX|nr:hypothetical protein CEXT_96231 [Caerostris extrusa]
MVQYVSPKHQHEGGNVHRQLIAIPLNQYYAPQNQQSSPFKTLNCLQQLRLNRFPLKPSNLRFSTIMCYPIQPKRSISRRHRECHTVELCTHVTEVRNTLLWTNKSMAFLSTINKKNHVSY